ncbi:MAG: Crp/Fnr family transcriptional regulator [Nannocystaceae bacterium]
MRLSIERLRRLRDWEALPEQTLEALCQAARIVHTARDEALFRRGDPEPGLFLVHCGEYKVSMLSVEGREQIVYLVDAGKLITEGFQPKGGDPCRVSAFAREASAAWSFPAADVRRLCHGCGALGNAVNATLSLRSNRMLDLIYDLSLRSVEQRVAAFLVYLSRRHDASVEVRIPRDLNVNTVASLLGTTREELTRTQSKLQKAGIIAITRHEVRVLDRKALARLVDGAEPPGPQIVM